MKQKLLSFIACVISILGCRSAYACGDACQSKNAQKSYHSISVDEFEKIIADKNITILDVRTAEEYAEGHIALAMNIDVKQADFLEKVKAYIGSLPIKGESEGGSLAVYCRSGNRSKKACDILSANGYKVVELSTGIMGWQNAGKAVTKEEVDVFTTAKSTNIYVHCIKHGSLSINIDDKWIYVDPVTDKVQPVTDYTTMPKADYILITHEHGDHLDAKAIEQLTKEGTTLIVNPRSSEILGGKGEVMRNGDSKEINSWKVDAVPAYNTSADKQKFHPKGRDNGYVLTIEGLRIYIAGDTEPIPEMNEIKNIDIAFLPCNLPFTMTPEQLAEAAKTIRPKVLFPYHYGKTDILQVVNLLEGSGIDVRIRQYQ